MLQFTSKEEEIGNIKLSKKYYHLDPEIISEWVGKAEVNEDEDITVMVSEHSHDRYKHENTIMCLACKR